MTLEERIEELLNQWKIDRAGYPIFEDPRAMVAYEVVRLCEEELQEVLDDSRRRPSADI